jgi:dolichol-phosphate mannosyltransferase
MAESTVFIVVPAYNEEGNLPGLLPDISQVLTGSGHKFEIIVVNDGSTDGTAPVVEEFSKSLPVRLISHEINRGAARAFITGLRAATRDAGPDDIIALMEADRTNDPALLTEMIRRIETGDDLVIGSRYRPGGSYFKFPAKRLILSRLANASLRVLFPIRGARDYTIFYRAYKASILLEGFRVFGDDLIEARTFVCNTELLIKLQMIQPLRISEVPLVYRYDLKRGKSKMQIGKTIREYFSFIRSIRQVAKITAAGQRAGKSVDSVLKT